MFRQFAFALSLGTVAIALPSPVMANNIEAAPVDPAKLKLAETMAGKIIPPGSYEKMMKTMADQMVETIIAQTMGMDAAMIAKGAGDDPSSVGGKSIGDLATEMDPHFKERMDITMKVMFDEMGKLMSVMEPSARGALAKVYAHKYSTAQLKDMNAFFATPSGSTFAADFMSTFSDKEMISAMMGEMPKVLEAMPAIMKKAEEATAHLPPPPKPAGTLPDCAIDGDESDCSPVDMAALAAVAAQEAAEETEAAAETASQRLGWSKADLKAVEKAEAELDAAYKKSSAAEIKVNAAVERAMRNTGQPIDEIMAAEDITADAVPPPAPPK